MVLSVTTYPSDINPIASAPLLDPKTPPMPTSSLGYVSLHSTSDFSLSAFNFPRVSLPKVTIRKSRDFLDQVEKVWKCLGVFFGYNPNWHGSYSNRGKTSSKENAPSDSPGDDPKASKDKKRELPIIKETDSALNASLVQANTTIEEAQKTTTDQLQTKESSADTKNIFSNPTLLLEKNKVFNGNLTMLSAFVREQINSNAFQQNSSNAKALIETLDEIINDKNSKSLIDLEPFKIIVRRVRFFSACNLTVNSKHLIENANLNEKQFQNLMLEIARNGDLDTLEWAYQSHRLTKEEILRPKNYNWNYNWRLVEYAVSSGQTAVLDWCVSKGVTIEEMVNTHSETLLSTHFHLAAHCSPKSLSVCRLIVNNSSLREKRKKFPATEELDEFMNFYSTPFTVAAINEQKKVLQWFLNQNEPVSQILLKNRATGETVIHKAADSTNLFLVNSLFNVGVSLKEMLKPDFLGRTPIHVATEKGYLNFIKWFYEKGASLEQMLQPECSGKTIIHKAAKQGHLHIIEWLYKKGVSLEQMLKLDCYCPPLHAAAEHGRLKIIKWFLEKNANLEQMLKPDKAGNTPIDLALQNCHLDVLKLFKSFGIDMQQTLTSGNFQKLIHTIAFDGNLELLKKFSNLATIKQMLVPDENGNTPIHKAAMRKNLDIVKWFFEQGATKSQLLKTNNMGENPIHYDLTIGDIKITQWFLENGTNVRTVFRPDSFRSTPFHYLANVGFLNTIKKISDLGVSVEQMLVPDVEGDTPIHKAAMRAHLNIIKWFFEQGASARQMLKPNSDGNTPFHVATGFHRLNVLEEFLKHFKIKDMLTANKQNKTPLQIAKDYKHDELVKWFEEKLSK